jgi:hypothetical protein
MFFSSFSNALAEDGQSGNQQYATYLPNKPTSEADVLNGTVSAGARP